MNDNRFVLCTSNTISSIIILHVQNCRRESSSRADQLKRIDKWHQSFHVIPLHSGQKPLKIANLPISKTNQFESPSLINSYHLTLDTQNLEFSSLIGVENYSKWLIWILWFWHFPPILVLLKLICLLTLFAWKLQVFKNSPKVAIFGIFNELLSTQNVKIARFARNVEWDFFFSKDFLYWFLPHCETL